MTKLGLVTSLLALLAAVGLSLPGFALAGNTSVTTSQRSNVRGGMVSSTTPTSQQPRVNPSFRRNKTFPFFVGVPVEQQPVSVTIEQTQVIAAAQPQNNTPKNRVYAPPHWVDTEHGVQVLEPGHWVDLDNGPEY